MHSLLVATVLCVLRLSAAIEVYLSPAPTFTRSYLSPQLASSVLSRHLGLEVFEALRDQHFTNSDPFVGSAPSNVLLLTLDEHDTSAVLPPTFKPSFNLSSPPMDSLSSVVATYLHRAAHTFVSVHDGGNSDSLAAFIQSAETPSFAALELTILSNLRRRHGPTSAEYLAATREIRQFLADAYENPNTIRVALLTFSSSLSSPEKRDSRAKTSQSPLPPTHPPPQEPIGSVSTCFASAESCSNGTNSCSGRGQCLEATKSGRTCFVCTCGVTKTGEGSRVKTDVWVGQSCERKDVSGPFVLLTGTVIVLLLLVFGSVSLLSSVGNSELPSTLLATAVHVKKD